MTIKSNQFKNLLSSLFLILFLPAAGLAQDIPGTEYIVKPGDTLWGIASSQYTDPFLWPKLWGKNRSVPHPDKIYPGEKIFLPSEEALKEIEKKEEANAAPETTSPAKPIEEASIQKENLETLEVSEESQPVQEEVKKEEGDAFQPETEVEETKKSSAWSIADLVTGGFILKNSTEDKKSGEIVASENEHLLLGEGDVVYVIPGESGGFKVGERFTIYERVKKVHHPRTKRLMGDLIRIKGVLEIIPNSMASKKDTYSAKIIKSYQLISLKDSLTAYHPIDPINVVLNEAPFLKDLKGIVVASKDIKENNGEHDIVYLDKGSQDGVRPGNLMVVFKEGKKAKFYSPAGFESLPRRVIAELEIIAVEKETSTAIVSRSLEPVTVGDQISNPPRNP
jgi:hypothetical protein